MKRLWKIFKKDEFLKDLKDEDWGPIMVQSNVDVANSILEENLCNILDKHAPMGIIQIRTTYKNWISQSNKDEMNTRDQAWQTARATGSNTDWDLYKKKQKLLYQETEG